MKKFFAAFVSLILCGTMLAFAACAANPTPSADNEQTVGDEESGDRPEVPVDHDSDILVVYFSATGNTERIANVIAEATGGNIFELVPVDPYTSADLRWTDENSRVVQEYENPELRDIEFVSTTVENWADYNTVFIGYPIWWYDAAWPVNGFVTANDFTGKTVYTFCTSSSSGLGSSTQNLADMAGSGDWRDGQRFRSGASESDVREWLQNLGF